MSLIPFPDIPNAPGVPALLRSATVPTIDSLVNQGISAALEAIFGPEKWGVYTSNGALALNHDVFLGIEYRNMYLVSNYPQEDGAFANYNKVGTPFDCKVKLAVGADKSARTSFLAGLDFMIKKIETYSVVTPEITYPEVTLENYQYRRTSRNGARVIVVDLWFKEIRKNVNTEKKETAEPQGQLMQSLGQIQEQAYNLVNGPIEYVSAAAEGEVSEFTGWSEWRVM